jgi:GT2 family glycosyltransferase
MKPTISIIIVYYKVKELLLECVDSIYNSKPKTSFEIIVVDNDEIKTVERKLLKKFPKVKYIKSPKNIGFGAGNNLGARNASGEYLFFLNPDTLVFKNAIDVLYNFLKKDKQTAIVAPLLLDKDNVPFKLQGARELTFLRAIFSLSFLNKLPFNKISSKYYLKEWNKKNKKEVDVVPGTAFMIRRNIFEKIGGFDERFFLYFEEFDLCNRVKKIGYRVFIEPKAKIFHKWGASTKYSTNINEIFAKSRYLYFKKHYGILKALFVEAFLKINKNSLFIFLILLLAIFLRIFNLSQGMVFIGDQGWFYLSARDLLEYGKIPLVGITSSHTWLHQGPLWTYLLSISLFIFKFDPIAGAFVSIMFGLFSTFLIYKIAEVLFSRKVGLISSLLYACSPLIVFSDRTPYHTSPIPFFVLVYYYALSKWISNDKKYFLISIIFIVFLYNFELATFSLFFPFLFLIAYGLYRKRKWVLNVFNKRYIFFSILSFAIPMAPILIYDIFNGFKQTIIFFAWTLYKPLNILYSSNSIFSFGNVLSFLSSGISSIIFSYSELISLFLFIFSLIFIIYRLNKNKNKIENPYFVLFLLIFFSFTSILINKTPSDAYLPMTFPLIVMSIALTIDYLTNFNKLKYIFYLLFFAQVFFNSYTSYMQDQRNYYKVLEDNTNKILFATKGKKYNLIGQGPGSQFQSFTMNYQYLLWLKNSFPSTKNEDLKVIIKSSGNEVDIIKK